jgi:hypothetical protein
LETLPEHCQLASSTSPSTSPSTTCQSGSSPPPGYALMGVDYSLSLSLSLSVCVCVCSSTN